MNMVMHQLRACSARARRPGDDEEDKINSKDDEAQSSAAMEVDEAGPVEETGSSTETTNIPVAAAAAAAAAVPYIDSDSEDDSEVQIVEGGNAGAALKSCPSSPPRPTRPRNELSSMETPTQEMRRRRRRLDPEVVDLSEDTPSPSRPEQQHQQQEGPGDDQWTCPQCTLYNHKSSTSCTACLYPNPERPPDPTRTERLIGGDQSSMSPMVFVGGGALMGGILGAAGSFIHGRDPFSAAAEGAMTGVMGGAFLNEILSPSSSRRNERGQHASQENVAATGSIDESLVEELINSHASDFYQDRPISVAQARSSASITGGYPSMGGGYGTENRDSYRRAQPRSSFRVALEHNNDGTRTTTVMGGNSTTQIRRIHQRDMIDAINDPMFGLLLHSHLEQQLQRQGAQHNVDGMGYEELLRAFGDGTENLGANDAQIESLPTRVVSDPLKELPEDARQCLICLEDICQGETRKILPCFHGFHLQCCDKWLRTNGSCPICKHRIR